MKLLWLVLLGIDIIKMGSKSPSVQAIFLSFSVTVIVSTHSIHTLYTPNTHIYKSASRCMMYNVTHTHTLFLSVNMHVCVRARVCVYIYIYDDDDDEEKKLSVKTSQSPVVCLQENDCFQRLVLGGQRRLVWRGGVGLL